MQRTAYRTIHRLNAFGRYEIVRRIGVGGMGEVFYAYAYGVARTRKPVVIKVLRPEMLSEPGAAEMFVEEGRLSLHLNHSNILQVFDFGKADDRYFMAMEYVDGVHLGDLRKRAGGKLPAEQALFVAMEVCLGLDYAHRLKDDAGVALHVVHRDVTPSNVLVSREGEVKLADFGIARATGRSQHTQAGQIRGKVRYMSPEAARGEPLDHRADIFSLGAMLFEMLTGRKTFDAKGREAILQQIVSTTAPAPSAIEDDVHPALDAVVLKALAPKREDRFADAFAMSRALEDAAKEAGFRPSRGSFLGFLRALEDADPPSVTPGTQPVASLTPNALTPNALTPDDVPIWPAPPVLASTAAVDSPGSSRPSRPSSSLGTVPAPAPQREGSVLPTGVASPVLFTLQIAGAEGTPSVREVPRFEVTKFEAPPAERTTDKPAYREGLDVPLQEEPQNAPTLPPLASTQPISRAVDLEPPTADRDDLRPTAGSAPRWRVRKQEVTVPPVRRERRLATLAFAGGGVLLVLIAMVIVLQARDRDAAIARATPTPTPVRTTATPMPTPSRVAVATPVRTPAMPRATPKPTPVVAAAPGLVDINSDPWSEVLANGKPLGHTPLLNQPLPVGKVVLVFRRTGVERSVTIDVRSGKNPPVLVTLRP